MSNKEITIVGYAGHAYSVIDAALAQGLQIGSYCDKYEAVNNPFNLHYKGDESRRDFPWEQIHSCVLGIGDNKIRYHVGEEIIKNGKDLISIVHPASRVSQFAGYGVGVFVNAGAVVNTFVEIGDYAILNTGCIVEHECKLGRAVHIAPGAVLAGGIKVGDHTFIGANAVVRQGVNIGNNVVIGAGTVVVSDVLDDMIFVGNPGKKLDKK